MKYCIRCMEPLTEGKCQSCGCSQDYFAQAHHLLPGTILNGKYCIGAALGEGGFGITYIGRDILLDRRVAIKEYFPGGFVNRSATLSPDVQPYNSEERAEFFYKGRERYLKEARILAQFTGEPGIVDVWDFFEENGTAYIVMEYLDGERLLDYLKRNGRMRPEDALSLLRPAMDSLEKVHQKGLIHRDISPDNIMLVNGSPQLIDFGSARNVSRERTTSVFLTVKKGYTPEEQYNTWGDLGTWTDVYALSATLYYCITGVVPDEATSRQQRDNTRTEVFRDTLKPPSEMGIEISPVFEAALMKGMAVYARDRFQSIPELLAGLSGEIPVDDDEGRTHLRKVTATDHASEPENAVRLQKSEVPVYPQPQEPEQPVYDPPQDTPVAKTKPKKKKKGKKLPLLIGGAAAVVAVLAALVVLSTSMGAIKIGDQTFKRDEESLYLRHMELTVSDLETLSKMKKLDSLTIHDCTFAAGAREKLSALPSSIRYLYLTGIELTDQDLKTVDPSRMKDLLVIELNDNPSLTDLSPLTSNFGTLTTLRLNGTGVRDFTVLRDAAKLTTIEVSRCPGADFTTLHVPSLYTICAENDDLTDISFLAAHERLGTLDLSNNQISDLTPMAGLTELDKLYLGNNKVADITPLAGMSRLDKLELQDNAIKSLRPLNDVKSLYYLDVCRNKLINLDGLETAIKLAHLYAAENQLFDVDGIENCTVLQTVNLRGNHLTNLGPLSKNADTLKVVQVSNNNLTGLSELADCEQLNVLIADYNNITSLADLKKCVNLQVVSAESNDLTSLAGLEDVTSLQVLYVPSNDISDISVLQDVNALSSTTLKVLNLANNEISDLTLNPMIKYHALLVYNNPLKDAEVIRKLTGDKLYLSYYDGIQINGLTDGYYACTLVDVPLDKQVAIKKDSGREYSITYHTWYETQMEIYTAKQDLMGVIYGEPDELSEQE